MLLAIVYRPFLLSRALLIPLGAVAVLLAVIVTGVWTTSRMSSTRGCRRATRRPTLHFQVYDFIPQTIEAYPLFGFGLNTFSVYFEFVTGRTRWGAHSYYVATVVETGIVGTIVFALFLVYLSCGSALPRRIGRLLAAAGDAIAAAYGRLRGG